MALGWLPPLGCVNNAAMDVGVRISVAASALRCSEYVRRGDSAGDGRSVFNFLEE